MFSKKRHPIICLLEIPVEIFVYAIVVGLGVRLDQLIFSNQGAEGAMGHGYPLSILSGIPFRRDRKRSGRRTRCR